MPLEEDVNDACVAVVLTVRVEVPEPVATELGLNEQVGAGVPPPVTLLQARLTLPAKPFNGAMVIVEVADPPAETLAGDNAEAETSKSCVVRFSVVL